MVDLLEHLGRLKYRNPHWRRNLQQEGDFPYCERDTHIHIVDHWDIARYTEAPHCSALQKCGVMLSGRNGTTLLRHLVGTCKELTLRLRMERNLRIGLSVAIIIWWTPIVMGSMCIVLVWICRCMWAGMTSKSVLVVVIVGVTCVLKSCATWTVVWVGTSWRYWKSFAF